MVLIRYSEEVWRPPPDCPPQCPRVPSEAPAITLRQKEGRPDDRYRASPSTRSIRDARKTKTKGTATESVRQDRPTKKRPDAHDLPERRRTRGH